MTPADPVWFYWPVTFATAAVVAAVHLSAVARRHAPSHDTGLGLGLVGAVSVALPIVPLMFGVSADCNDTGHGINFNVVGVALGGVGLLAWMAILWRLYVAAGLAPSEAQRAPVALFLAVAVGMFLEFFVSTITMEGYCNGIRSWLYAQLTAAAVIATIAGTAVYVGTRRRMLPAGR